MTSQNPISRRPIPKKQRSLATTLFFEIFTLLTITVLLTGIATFFLARHELMTKAVSHLQSSVYERERTLEESLARQRSQLSIIARDPALTKISSVTELVGFRSLLSLDNQGRGTVIAGNNDAKYIETSTLMEMTESAHSGFKPIFDTKGWSSYLLSAPRVNRDGKRIGTLVAMFDPAILISRLFDTASMDRSSEVLLASIENGTPILLHSDGKGGAVPVQTDDEKQRLTVARTTEIKQGIEKTTDYSGIPVLSAYGTMPSIGWTIIVQMDRYEILKPIVRLAVNVTGIGLMLICLLSLSIFTLSRRIIEPLTELVRKLDGLETVHWRFKRSVFTGNEIESVDRAAEELTGRLRESYDHLESIIRQRTEALREENAQNKAILENIEYGLIMTDEQGNVVYANRNAELLLEAEAGKLCGLPITEALPMTDEKSVLFSKDAHPISSVLKRKISFSPIADPNYSLSRRDGKNPAIHLRATPILRGRECLGAVAVFRDITEERRIGKVKSEFITLVSHQLRTPLSSIRWNLEMLLESVQREKLSAEEHDYLDEIGVSNARMVHLVDALLNVSRLELRTQQPKIENVSLAGLLSDVTDCFKLELRRKKIAVKIDADTRSLLHPATDRSLLQLIVENLVSNAIKYGKENGELLVKLSGDAEGKNVIIAVSDQGIGIPERERGMLFQKMFRCSNAKATDTNGNGLGLYISKIAADTIGATIDVVSTEGKGATFTVTIPMSKGKKTEGS